MKSLRLKGLELKLGLKSPGWECSLTLALCLKEVSIQEWVIMVWSLYMDKWSRFSKDRNCAAAPFFRSELGSRQELGKEKVANSMDLAFILCVSAIFYLVIYILLLLK